MAASNRDPRHVREYSSLALPVRPPVDGDTCDVPRRPLAWQLASISMSTAMAAASVVDALAVADGLFVNPPLEPGR